MFPCSSYSARRLLARHNWGRNGNPWQLMQGLNHGRFFFFFFAMAVEQQVAISAASDGFAHNAAAFSVTSWLLQGFIVCLTAATCHQHEVLKRFRKCCRSFAGHTSSNCLHLHRVLSFCGCGSLRVKCSCARLVFKQVEQQMHPKTARFEAGQKGSRADCFYFQSWDVLFYSELLTFNPCLRSLSIIKLLNEQLLRLG